MEILAQARDALRQRKFDRSRTVTIHCLSPDEAIGREASDDYPIRKGRERVIEAVIGDARGQAFTDEPSEWSGTVGELFDLDLGVVRERALFVAGLNAVMCSMGAACATIHCRDNSPALCGNELAEVVGREFGAVRVGLIGLQPSILGGLAWEFGPCNVRAIDLNPENIGLVRQGVLIGNGATDLEDLAEWCDVVLATGSSIVNDSINDILAVMRSVRKPVIFYGNTIAGTAALLGLRRLCPYGI